MMLLHVDDLHARYGATPVLFGVTFDVAPGEVISFLGRNGMGKTTTVKSLLGMLRASGGTISFDGSDVTQSKSHIIAQSGIGLVPEGRQIFANLSVAENLVATAANRRNIANPWTLDRVYTLFPRLEERSKNRGSQLSGGEQQMLAIGRALMTNPKLLILDEATEGLAPLIRQEIWDCLRALRQEQLSMIIIDKSLPALMSIADRHFIIEKGRIVWSGTSTDLSSAEDIKARYLAV